MDICRICATAVFAVTTAASAAQMKDMVMRVPLMPRAPVVDGVVDAKEWQAASGSVGFVRFRSAGDSLEPVGSSFWVGRTADRLFLAGI
ncbi:MAG: hypothetical protein IJG13_22945, partial [Kiritimatiellae bacterium]|nr:hypothetical protein [Kiritimatiellia bacterium]